MTEEYWQQYWATNKQKLLTKRAERYKTDPEYRAKAIERAKLRYQQLKAQKPVVEKTVPKRVAAATRTLRPKAVMVGGKVLMVRHMAELARLCKVSPETLKSWEERGIIPKATMLDDNGRRWYSNEYISVMAKCAEKHWSDVKELEAFKAVVAAAFKKAGAK